MSVAQGITQTTGLQNIPILAKNSHNYLQEEVVISSPANLPAGTVVQGTIAAAVIWDNATDVIGVLLEDVDATDGDVSGIVAYGGPFNVNALNATTTPVTAGLLPGNRLIQAVEEL